MPRAGLWIFVYTFLTFVTNAYFMADTVDYVAAVDKYDQGINYVFWDFRHLFWRPLGWVVLHLVNPFLSAAARSEPRIVVIYIFLVLNWIAGLFSLFLFRALLRRFCAQWTIEFSSVTFVFSFAFLNYVHSGSSYIPGLMFLLLGLYFLSRGVDPGTSNSLQYWGPLSLAISVCLWFPYAFAVPGALVLPLFSPDRNLQRWPLVLRNTAICVLAGIVAYEPYWPIRESTLLLELFSGSAKVRLALLECAASTAPSSASLIRLSTWAGTACCSSAFCCMTLTTQCRSHN